MRGRRTKDQSNGTYLEEIEAVVSELRAELLSLEMTSSVKTSLARRIAARFYTNAFFPKSRIARV